MRELIDILRLAYSGELAAAYAYRGHWHSVRDEETRASIRKIEQDEWHHRRLVGVMLSRVGEKPGILRETRAFLVGQTLRIFCHVFGRLAPMYAAGRLESRNIREYETAARLAVACDHSEFADCLLTMAEVEWDHEQYFRSVVLQHRWAARLPMWPAPPPREEIRRSFARELSTPISSVCEIPELAYGCK